MSPCVSLHACDGVGSCDYLTICPSTHRTRARLISVSCRYSTEMNAESSRSHLVIGIVMESTNKATGNVVKGKVGHGGMWPAKVEKLVSVSNSVSYNQYSLSVSVCLSVCLSHACTRTQSHMHPHLHNQMHTHTHTHTHTYTHTHTHSLAHSYTCTHKHTHSLTHSLTHTHTRSLAHTHARTHARTHTHTHTHKMKSFCSPKKKSGLGMGLLLFFSLGVNAL